MESLLICGDRVYVDQKLINHGSLCHNDCDLIYLGVKSRNDQVSKNIA